MGSVPLFVFAVAIAGLATWVFMRVWVMMLGSRPVTYAALVPVGNTVAIVLGLVAASTAGFDSDLAYYIACGSLCAMVLWVAVRGMIRTAGQDVFKRP